MKTSKRIILASNSPRRRELLAGLDIDFEVRVKEDISEDYPPHLSMEQCSSEQTAAYKSALAARLLSEGTRTDQESVFVDLTGGLGVDFSFLASSLGMRSVYVERNRQLCDLATHNLPLL